MLKNQLPLQPNNPKIIEKPGKFPEKPKNNEEKTINTDVWDCDEDIQVIDFPISTFTDREPFQQLPIEVESAPNWAPFETLYASNLLSKELEYIPNPYYLQTMQPFISSSMRLVLYDWMMEVCSEFTLKRETFHLSVNYVDRYLSRHCGVKKEEYQLLGLACMYIAGKVEEVLPPFLSDWASSADNGYSTSMITYMEKCILRTLDYKIFPSTAYNWTNWMMTEWDNYIEFHFGCVAGNNPKDFELFADKKKVKEAYEERMILFKQANQKAYKRYRETMQILDVSVLHSCSMKFMPRHLACGLLYLMISKFFYETNYALLYYTGDYKDQNCENSKYAEIIESFDNPDPFYLESAAAVQELFANFIRTAVNIENIEDIYGSVAFFHPFLEFEAVYDLPVVCRVQSKTKLESHYEEFLAYQTHNTKNIDFLTKNLKDN